MDQKHISKMENIHKKHSDIDDFINEIVNYIKENDISDDTFFEWWDEVDSSNGSSFLNDMVQIAEGWDFHFD